jgi:predicted metal-dependent peptidase
LFALRPIVSWRAPTMAADRFWRCYVFPGFLATTPVDELAGVWVHEVSHLLRDHHGRGERLAARHDGAGSGERLRMNIAADFEINDDAYGEGLLPRESR